MFHIYKKDLLLKILLNDEYMNYMKIYFNYGGRTESMMSTLSKGTRLPPYPPPAEVVTDQ